MVKPNYQFEKRQRDLAKKKKQEEKRQQKMAAKTAANQACIDTENRPEAIGGNDTSAASPDSE